MNPSDRRSASTTIRSAMPVIGPVARQHLIDATRHFQAKRFADAATAYRQAIALEPNVVEFHINLGSILRELGRLEEAAGSLARALALRPDAPEAHYNLGVVQMALGRPDEALACYERALALKPDFLAAQCNLGNVLQAMGRGDEAVAAYRKGLVLAPNDPDLHNNLGAVLEALGRLDEATAAYVKAVALAPDFAGAVGNLTNARLQVCDWGSLAADTERCKALVRSGVRGISPFVLLMLPTTPAEQLAGARLEAAVIAREAGRLPSVPRLRPRDKLRLAYLSGDFRQHAVAVLAAEMFEHHDRTRFEVTAYSFGADDGSDMRRRLERAFDRFVDIGPLAHAEAAQRIRDDGIDVLVDLGGYTKGARTAIVARRPAPIQVSFLGYVGTMGAGFIDYVIADAVALPASQQRYYDERIVQLPGSFMPCDTRRESAALIPTRAACGLPENGFVFCCFNRSYKITPAVFDVWMRLLCAVPDSVLWLFDTNATARSNLCAAATERGVAPERLVFAPFQDLPEHLARHNRADLFLDTPVFNAHTTANLALWVGLPVLTCAGETFIGRAGASLLSALDLPELVTHSLADYEALALALATDPQRLRALRRRLGEARATSPVFDAARYTRNLEAAYGRMWETWISGRPPEPIAIPE